MLTRDQLSDALMTVNVEAVAKEADVSIKTIYRLRHKANPPNYQTVERIVLALERLKSTAVVKTA